MRSLTRPARGREAFIIAGCLLASLAVNQIGLWYGRAFVSPGAGYPRPPAVTRDLFRFDSSYYLDVATLGYAYDGNPFSSPNIVFAPAFPMLIRVVPWADPVNAGFLINFILLIAASALSWRTLEQMFGGGVATFALLAQLTCEGSYAFHAFYSESTMFFFLAAVLYARQKGALRVMALATAGLGAARVAAGPIVALVAVDLWRGMRKGRLAWPEGLALVALSLSGTVGYLAYVAHAFGNPFRLLPEIQSASWGLFHPPTAWWKVFTGTYLFEYTLAAFDHAPDIRTVNLAWTLLALASVVILARRKDARGFTAIFAGYAAFVYAMDSSSEYLISSHRFFALMTPIFVVAALACAALPRVKARLLGASLLILNAALAIWHAGCFNQGTWFFF